MLHEVWQRAQLAGKDEVKQRPQLFQIVLYGRPRQDETMNSAKLAHAHNPLTNVYTRPTSLTQPLDLLPKKIHLIYFGHLFAGQRNLSIRVAYLVTLVQYDIVPVVLEQQLALTQDIIE